MSIDNVQNSINLIEKYFDEKDTIFGNPVNKKLIDKSEKILDIRFPKSYINFLEKKGFGGVGSLLISGIRANKDEDLFNTGVVWKNLEKRKSPFKLPSYLLEIENLGNGDVYALDTSQMNAEGECPVVVWPIGGYEATPILEIVAQDFGEFFLNMVKQQIAMQED